MFHVVWISVPHTFIEYSNSTVKECKQLLRYFKNIFCSIFIFGFSNGNFFLLPNQYICCKCTNLHAKKVVSSLFSCVDVNGGQWAMKWWRNWGIGIVVYEKTCENVVGREYVKQWGNESCICYKIIQDHKEKTNEVCGAYPQKVLEKLTSCGKLLSKRGRERQKGACEKLKQLDNKSLYEKHELHQNVR